MESILKLRNVSKKYGDQEILKSINLEVEAGEIHGLLGENGAGKSTLLNILFGRAVIRETGGYSGEIYFQGKEINIKNSHDAIKMGIGMVHQEFALIPDMTVAENIKLGREDVYSLTERLLGSGLALIDKEKNHQSTQMILKQLGVDIDSRLKVLNLSVNFKQFVELAREISKENLDLLILDEPTAALGQDDVPCFLALMNELSSRGIAIIFVSHRLEEVMAVCHRITVLRDGEKVAALGRDDFDINHIAESMIGHAICQAQAQTRNISGAIILQYLNFSVDMPGEAIENINLDVYKGEMLGIVSLSGHGKLALGNGTVGLYPSSGQVLLDGKKINTAEAGQAINSGIYLLPEERREAGLLLKHSILENVIFSAVQQKKRFLKPSIFPPLSFIDKKMSLSYVKEIIQHLDIRCHSPRQEVGQLSGGNQQKVCLARALAMEPHVLFIAEPTRGIDIRAKEIILEKLLDINREIGTTMLIASSELGEIKRICNRIVVMYEGRIFAILPSDCDDIELALALSGERLESSC